MKEFDSYVFINPTKTHIAVKMPKSPWGGGFLLLEGLRDHRLRQKLVRA